MAFLVAITALIPALPSAAVAPSNPAPASVLGQGWAWLDDNRNQIAALSGIFAACSLVVAALAFVKTQRLNQANAVYQAMKEARDLRLKQYPIAPSSAHSDFLMVVMHFYASIDQYRLSKLVDAQTWRNFERDLEPLVAQDTIGAWLEGKPGAPPTLAPASEFDPRFIQYLKGIRARVKQARGG